MSTRRQLPDQQITENVKNNVQIESKGTRRELPDEIFKKNNKNLENESKMEEAKRLADKFTNKTGEDPITKEDFLDFKKIISSMRGNSGMEEIREMMADSGIEEQLMKTVVKKGTRKNEEQKPSRKKTLKAQKNAKKTFNAVNKVEKTGLLKAIYFTRSRKVKNVTLQKSSEVQDAIKILGNNPHFVESWDELVIVGNSQNRHLRNKLSESVFNRISQLGDEIVIFIHNKDLDFEMIKTFSKRTNETSPYFCPEVEDEIEEKDEIPELVELKLDENVELKVDENVELKVDENVELKVDENVELKVDENVELKVEPLNNRIETQWDDLGIKWNDLLYKELSNSHMGD